MSVKFPLVVCFVQDFLSRIFSENRQKKIIYNSIKKLLDKGISQFCT